MINIKLKLYKAHMYSTCNVKVVYYCISTVINYKYILKRPHIIYFLKVMTI